MKKIAWFFVISILLSSEMVAAQNVSADTNTAILENAIDDYFSIEVATSVSKLVLAVIIFLTGVFIWKRSRFCKGLAGFLWFVALVETVVGSTVYLRTDKQVSNLLTQLKSSPSVFLSEESARMITIMDNFVGFQNMQIGVVLSGITFTLIGRLKNWPIIAGLGVGQISMGLALYLIDYPAVQAADKYLAVLQKAKF